MDTGHPTSSHGSIVAEPGSFRDRQGRIYYCQGGVYRGISAQALIEWHRLANTKFFARLSQDEKVVPTRLLLESQVPTPELLKEWPGVLLHDRIPFITYPYEWSFGMLKDAALLQLEILERALEEDMTLKDASSYNVQWNGIRPQFIDIPSFEWRIPDTPWVGYRQFCKLFLYPLMLTAYKDISFHPWLRGCIDGIDPADMNHLFGVLERFHAGVFMDVYMHAKLEDKYSRLNGSMKENIRRTGFRKELVRGNLRRLTAIISGLEWSKGRSVWSQYADENSYSDVDAEKKASFVRAALKAVPRTLVWDIGCNTGNYSILASDHSEYVVAMDFDHLAVERLYLKLGKEQRRGILPLVVNIADSSPGLGWRGAERKSLPDRGKPDLTLCLALIHHVVLSENIPLQEFLDWLAWLGTDLVIEFVAKNDPMVVGLLKNKADQYPDYSKENFEALLGKRFRIVSRESLASGTRFLYYANSMKKAGAV